MTTTTQTPVVARKPSPRRGGVRRWFREGGLSTFLFFIPVLVIFGVFSFYPIVRAVIMSLQSTNLFDAPKWVGFENFSYVLGDPILMKALKNTAYFALLALIFGYPIPLIAAVLMSEVRRRKGLYSVLAYLPVVVPPVVAALLWKYFYTADLSGVFNSIAHWFGLGPYPWLQNKSTAMPSIVLMATWANAGGTVIIYLAALAGVNPDLYDAAGIDGAGIWRKIWHVTMPQLRAVLLITLILQIIGTAQVFLEPWLMTSGGPNHATETILLLIYNYAFGLSAGGDYGAATALSVMLAVGLGLISAIYFRLTRSWSTNS